MNIPCESCGYDPTLKIFGSWLLELPFEALSGNFLKSNVRGYVGAPYRRYRDKCLAHLQPLVKNIPPATQRRRVTFIRHFASPKRRFDSGDNLAQGFKGVRDTLKTLKMLVDDNDRYLEPHYRQIKTDLNYMTIILEDVCWPPT
jgi:hypothetical protein